MSSWKELTPAQRDALCMKASRMPAMQAIAKWNLARRQKAKKAHQKGKRR